MLESLSRAGEDPGPKTEEVRPLAGDLLEGASEIAEFIYGDRKKRRKVYHLAEKAQLPHFKFGSVLCARKSKLLDWIAKQEARSSAAD